MDLISQVTLMGGACTRASLLTLRSRAEVDAALRDGTLLTTARGRYALATSPESVRRASTVSGVLSHRSAALHWGWAQKSVPTRPDVTVPRTRRVAPGARRADRAALVRSRGRGRRRAVHQPSPHPGGLHAEPPQGRVPRHRRQRDPGRRLHPRRARSPWPMRPSAADAPRSSRPRGRPLARLRTCSSRCCGRKPDRSRAYRCRRSCPSRTRGRPRVIHPDLADPALRIALEAESFEWHGKSAALTRDCRRYNVLAQLGWVVVRFSWYLVMFEPAYVQSTLIEVVDLVRRHANVAAWAEEHPLRHTGDIRMFVGGPPPPAVYPPPAHPCPKPHRAS